MFEQGFATLFRAVDRIRQQLESADSGLRQHLAEELICIQQLGERYIDYWMTLDEQIGELLDSYQLEPMSAMQAADNAAVFVKDPLVAGAPQPLKTVAGDSGSRTSRVVDYTPGEWPQDDIEPWLDVAFDMSDSVSLAFRKGLGYYDLFMFEEAIQALEEVVESSNHCLGHLYLSASHAANRQLDKAFHHLRIVQSMTREPLFLAAAEELEAMLHFHLQNYATAIQCLQSVSSRIPKYPDAWFNLGMCYFLADDAAAAAAALKQCLQLQPDDVEAWRLLSYVCLQSKELDQARSACQQGLQRQPLHLDLLQLQAVIERASGNYRACERLCKRIVNLDPNRTLPWYMLAWTYAKTSREHQALALLKMRLSLARDDERALLQLGLLYLMQGDGPRAEQVLLRCFPTPVNKSLLWMALGKVSAMAGQEQQARSRYLRAMRDPRKPVRRLAMYHCAQLLIQHGKFEEAETYLKGAALLGPPNPAIYQALALCAERQGRSYEAEKFLRNADECRPLPDKIH